MGHGPYVDNIPFVSMDHMIHICNVTRYEDVSGIYKVVIHIYTVTTISTVRVTATGVRGP